MYHTADCTISCRKMLEKCIQCLYSAGEAFVHVCTHIMSMSVSSLYTCKCRHYEHVSAIPICPCATARFTATGPFWNRPAVANQAVTQCFEAGWSLTCTYALHKCAHMLSLFTTLTSRCCYIDNLRTRPIIVLRPCFMGGPGNEAVGPSWLHMCMQQQSRHLSCS